MRRAAEFGAHAEQDKMAAVATDSAGHFAWAVLSQYLLLAKNTTLWDPVTSVRAQFSATPKLAYEPTIGPNNNQAANE